MWEKIFDGNDYLTNVLRPLFRDVRSEIFTLQIFFKRLLFSISNQIRLKMYLDTCITVPWRGKQLS